MFDLSKFRSLSIWAPGRRREQKYTKISVEEGDTEELLTQREIRNGSQAKLRAFILAGIVLASHSEPQWIPCGSTAAEARAANCHYEPMQRSWIPDACYFEEPSSEYDPFGDRPWFSDRNLTIPANLDRLRSGDEELAFVRYFHDEHCLYSWRKLHLAVQLGRRLTDTKTYDLHHTMHCARGIANLIVVSKQDGYKSPPNEYTESPLMFQECVKMF
ncbi:conserved hypothetical protein [Talaromyces stipitatus ATCC 10500]|uniref:Uncharacterized protein n=1 Tax=Talaromyces stipitatus (strain ATCC 10500 / CBS 375.48 / QM 6759 / NRRL 1006) TaxID=441959 RepID=B8M0F7_TALSN|nr:uncharacterized protein TSTA_084850 [Talaromyces stipitatus ATCC 10500]EED21254.1 conserved hypothetical protein [Talaromyces stipitatus ATCC 10500]